MVPTEACQVCTEMSIRDECFSVKVDVTGLPIHSNASDFENSP